MEDYTRTSRGTVLLSEAAKRNKRLLDLFKIGDDKYSRRTDSTSKRLSRPRINEPANRKKIVTRPKSLHDVRVRYDVDSNWVSKTIDFPEKASDSLYGRDRQESRIRESGTGDSNSKDCFIESKLIDSEYTKQKSFDLQPSYTGSSLVKSPRFYSTSKHISIDEEEIKRFPKYDEVDAKFLDSTRTASQNISAKNMEYSEIKDTRANSPQLNSKEIEKHSLSVVPDFSHTPGFCTFTQNSGMRERELGPRRVASSSNRVSNQNTDVHKTVESEINSSAYLAQLSAYGSQENRPISQKQESGMGGSSSYNTSKHRGVAEYEKEENVDGLKIEAAECGSVMETKYSKVLVPKERTESFGNDDVKFIEDLMEELRMLNKDLVPIISERKTSLEGMGEREMLDLKEIETNVNCDESGLKEKYRRQCCASSDPKNTSEIIYSLDVINEHNGAMVSDQTVRISDSNIDRTVDNRIKVVGNCEKANNSGTAEKNYGAEERKNGKCVSTFRDIDTTIDNDANIGQSGFNRDNFIAKPFDVDSINRTTMNAVQSQEAIGTDTITSPASNPDEGIANERTAKDLTPLNNNESCAKRNGDSKDYAYLGVAAVFPQQAESVDSGTLFKEHYDVARETGAELNANAHLISEKCDDHIHKSTDVEKSITCLATENGNDTMIPDQIVRADELNSKVITCSKSDTLNSAASVAMVQETVNTCSVNEDTAVFTEQNDNEENDLCLIGKEIKGKGMFIQCSEQGVDDFDVLAEADNGKAIRQSETGREKFGMLSGTSDEGLSVPSVSEKDEKEKLSSGKEYGIDNTAIIEKTVQCTISNTTPEKMGDLKGLAAGNTEIAISEKDIQVEPDGGSASIDDLTTADEFDARFARLYRALKQFSLDSKLYKAHKIRKVASRRKSSEAEDVIGQCSWERFESEEKSHESKIPFSRDSNNFEIFKARLKKSKDFEAKDDTLEDDKHSKITERDKVKCYNAATLQERLNGTQLLSIREKIDLREKDVQFEENINHKDDGSLSTERERVHKEATKEETKENGNIDEEVSSVRYRRRSRLMQQDKDSFSTEKEAEFKEVTTEEKNGRQSYDEEESSMRFRRRSRLIEHDRDSFSNEKEDEIKEATTEEKNERRSNGEEESSARYRRRSRLLQEENELMFSEKESASKVVTIEETRERKGDDEEGHSTGSRRRSRLLQQHNDSFFIEKKSEYKEVTTEERKERRVDNEDSSLRNRRRSRILQQHSDPLPNEEEIEPKEVTMEEMKERRVDNEDSSLRNRRRSRILQQHSDPLPNEEEIEPKVVTMEEMKERRFENEADIGTRFRRRSGHKQEDKDSAPKEKEELKEELNDSKASLVYPDINASSQALEKNDRRFRRRPRILNNPDAMCTEEERIEELTSAEDREDRKDQIHYGDETTHGRGSRSSKHYEADAIKIDTKDRDLKHEILDVQKDIDNGSKDFEVTEITTKRTSRSVENDVTDKDSLADVASEAQVDESTRCQDFEDDDTGLRSRFRVFKDFDKKDKKKKKVHCRRAPAAPQNSEEDGEILAIENIQDLRYQTLERANYDQAVTGNYLQKEGLSDGRSIASDSRAQDEEGVIGSRQSDEYNTGRQRRSIYNELCSKDGERKEDMQSANEGVRHTKTFDKEEGADDYKGRYRRSRYTEESFWEDQKRDRDEDGIYYHDNNASNKMQETFDSDQSDVGYQRRFRRSKYSDTRDENDLKKERKIVDATVSEEEVKSKGQETADIEVSTESYLRRRRRSRSIDSSIDNDQKVEGRRDSDAVRGEKAENAQQWITESEESIERDRRGLRISRYFEASAEEDQAKEDIRESDAAVVEVTENKTQQASESKETAAGYRRRFRKSKCFETSADEEQEKEDKRDSTIVREEPEIFESNESIENIWKAFRRSRRDKSLEDDQKDEDRGDMNIILGDEETNKREETTDNEASTEGYRRQFRGSSYPNVEDGKKQEDTRNSDAVRVGKVKSMKQEIVESKESTEPVRRRSITSRYFESSADEDQEEEEKGKSEAVVEEVVESTLHETSESKETAESCKRRLRRSGYFEERTDEDQGKEDIGDNEAAVEEVTENKKQRISKNEETAESYRRRSRKSRYFETSADEDQGSENRRESNAVCEDEVEDHRQEMQQSEESSESCSRRLRRSQCFESSIEHDQKIIEDREEIDTACKDYTEPKTREASESEEFTENYEKQLRSLRDFEKSAEDGKREEDGKDTMLVIDESLKMKDGDIHGSEDLGENYRRRFRRMRYFQSSAEDENKVDDVEAADITSSNEQECVEQNTFDSEESTSGQRKRFRRSRYMDSCSVDMQAANMTSNGEQEKVKKQIFESNDSASGYRRRFRRSRYVDSSAENEERKEYEKDVCIAGKEDAINATQDASDEEESKRFSRSRFIKTNDEDIEGRKEDGVLIDDQSEQRKEPKPAEIKKDEEVSIRRYRRSRYFDTNGEDHQDTKQNDDDVTNDQVGQIKNTAPEGIKEHEGCSIRPFRRSRYFDTQVKNYQFAKQDDDDVVNDEVGLRRDSGLDRTEEDEAVSVRRFRRSRYFDRNGEDYQDRKEDDNSINVGEKRETENENKDGSLRQYTKSKDFDSNVEGHERSEAKEDFGATIGEEVQMKEKWSVNSTNEEENTCRRHRRSRHLYSGVENLEREDANEDSGAVPDVEVKMKESRSPDSAREEERSFRRYRRSKYFESSVEDQEGKDAREDYGAVPDEEVKMKESRSPDSTREEEGSFRRYRRSKYFESSVEDHEGKDAKEDYGAVPDEEVKMKESRSPDSTREEEGSFRRYRRSKYFESSVEDHEGKDAREDYGAVPDEEVKMKESRSPDSTREEEGSFRRYRRSKYFESSVEDQEGKDAREDYGTAPDEEVHMKKSRSRDSTREEEGSFRRYRRSKYFESSVEDHEGKDAREDYGAVPDEEVHMKESRSRDSTREEEGSFRRYRRSKYFESSVEDQEGKDAREDYGAVPDEEVKMKESRSRDSAIEEEGSFRRYRRSKYFESSVEDHEGKDAREDYGAVPDEEVKMKESRSPDSTREEEGSFRRYRRSKYFESSVEDQEGKDAKEDYGAVPDEEVKMKESRSRDSAIEEEDSFRRYRRSRFLEDNVNNVNESDSREESSLSNLRQNDLELNDSSCREEESPRRYGRSKYFETNVPDQGNQRNEVSEVSGDMKDHGVQEKEDMQRGGQSGEVSYKQQRRSRYFETDFDDGQGGGVEEILRTQSKEIKDNFEREDVERGEKGSFDGVVLLEDDRDKDNRTEDEGVVSICDKPSKTSAVTDAVSKGHGYDADAAEDGTTNKGVQYLNLDKCTELALSVNGQQLNNSMQCDVISTPMHSTDHEKYQGKLATAHLDLVALVSPRNTPRLESSDQPIIDTADSKSTSVDREVINTGVAGNVIEDEIVEQENVAESKEADLRKNDSNEKSEATSEEQKDRKVENCDEDSCEGYYINYIEDPWLGHTRSADLMRDTIDESTEFHATGSVNRKQAYLAADFDNFESKMRRIKEKMRRLVDKNNEMEERIEYGGREADVCEDTQWQYFQQQNKLLQLAVSKLWRKEGFDSSRLIQDQDNNVYMSGYDLYRKR